MKAIVVLDWPKATHDGGGKCVFIVEPGTTEEQVDCLAQIYTGQLGGDPWAILGTTFDVAGLVGAPITFDGAGVTAKISAEGSATAAATPCGIPSPESHTKPRLSFLTASSGRKGTAASAASRFKPKIHLKCDDTNWIFYEFDWSNS